MAYRTDLARPSLRPHNSNYENESILRFFFTASLEKLPFQARQLRAYQSPNLLQDITFIRQL